MTKQEAISAANKMGWYHTVRLFDDYVTPCYTKAANLPLWNMIRSVRASLPYKGKKVLDVGTWDGMWAFEAEDLGASTVVGFDDWSKRPNGLAQTQFAADVRKSRAHFLKADLYNLPKDLPGAPFDIVQNLGVLYHLAHPLLGLEVLRKMTKTGGMMLLETAWWDNESATPMMLSNGKGDVYGGDQMTFWAPNHACLSWMIKITGWGKPIAHADLRRKPIKRCCWICPAV